MAEVRGTRELDSVASYEDAVDLGRRLVKVGEVVQWDLGDLANAVQTRYGGHNLENFAADIGVQYATLRDYKRVSSAYPRDQIDRSLPTPSPPPAHIAYITEQGYSVPEVMRKIYARHDGAALLKLAGIRRR